MRNQPYKRAWRCIGVWEASSDGHRNNPVVKLLIELLRHVVSAGSVFNSQVEPILVCDVLTTSCSIRVVGIDVTGAWDSRYFSINVDRDVLSKDCDEILPVWHVVRDDRGDWTLFALDCCLQFVWCAGMHRSKLTIVKNLEWGIRSVWKEKFCDAISIFAPGKEAYRFLQRRSPVGDSPVYASCIVVADKAFGSRAFQVVVGPFLSLQARYIPCSRQLKWVFWRVVSSVWRKHD